MRARAGVPWLVALACAVWLHLPVAASASHTVFSSAVDRFEVDGNPFGSADGAFDYVDEFDDGTLAPDWAPLLGTAVEAGGVATLENPGTDFPIGGNLDVSNIENEDGVENGAGNVTASAYWVPELPLTDREFHFQLYGVGAVIESAGLTVTNLSAAAAAQSPPALAGPAVSRQLIHIDGTGFHTNAFATVPIDPGAITGRIVLRLSFDDASDMLTGSFSLDGGATFQSPFPPVHIFEGVSDSEFLLGAASTESGSPPPPSSQTIGTKQLLVKNPSVPASRRVIYQVKEPRFSGHSLVGDPTIGGATLNVKLDGVTQCFVMPSAAWTRSGPSFRYADPFGVHGPVAVAEIKDKGSGRLEMKAVVMGRLGPIDLAPPNPGVQGDTNLSVGGGSQYCGSTAGGPIKPNTQKTFKARGAPPPAACNVGPC